MGAQRWSRSEKWSATLSRAAREGKIGAQRWSRSEKWSERRISAARLRGFLPPFSRTSRRASSASLRCGGSSGGSPSSRAFSRVTHIIVWLSAGGLCWQAFVPSCELFSFVKERCVTSAPNVDGALNDVERVFNFRPLDMFSNLFDSADAAPAQPNHHQRVFLLQEFPHFPKELF